MLIQGDSRFLPFTDNSIQCVVTSPPYWGLRDYGVGGQLGLESTPEEYVANMVGVFREVSRVLRDDGTVWCNLGDSYAQGGSGGYGPASTLSGYTSENTKHRLAYDTAFTRKAPPGLKPKDLVGIPWRVAFALQADGWYLRSDIIWSKPNPMPESVTDRPTKAHEYVFLLSKRERYYFDQGAVREDGSSHREFWKETRGNGSTAMMNGRASRQANGPSGFGATGSRNIRTVWTIATQPYSEAHFATFPEALAKRCILAGTSAHGACSECGAPWERVVERVSTGKSYAVEKSEAKRKSGLVTAFSGYDDGSSCPQFKTVGWKPTCNHDAPVTACVVLDPFAGSGTTVKVAQDLGRIGVGVDLKPDYLQMACKRSAQQGLMLA